MWYLMRVWLIVWYNDILNSYSKRKTLQLHAEAQTEQNMQFGAGAILLACNINDEIFITCQGFL